MSIKILNEGFKLLHKNSLYEEKSNSSDLKKALESALNRLAMKQEMNIKKYEAAFQDAIESQFPEKSWWEVTDCNIFWDLMENRNPSLTIQHIIDNLKPEFKESLGENLEKERKRVPNSKTNKNRQEQLRKSIKESLRRKKLKESEKEPTIKRYSDVRPRSERKYWYFTTHGVQPGSIPRDLNVLEVRDGQNKKGTWGTFVMLDGVLNTSELRYYDMIELSPDWEEQEKRQNYDYLNFFDETEGKRITAWESFKNKRKNHFLKESSIDYIKWIQLPNGKWKIWGSNNGPELDPKFLDRARKQNGEEYKDAKVSKNGEYPDGVSEKDVWEKHRFSESVSKRNRRKSLNESFDDMQVFMNTWANYNEYGADGVLTPAGWMSIDDAIDYCEEYAEYEPFINDTDNIPFDDVNEYSNASSVLQELKELQESDVDEDVVAAIVEATGYNVKKAVEIAESGDYFWYPGLSSYTDLAYAVIDEIGSLKDALGDRVVNYIDEDQMRREYRWDIREIMRDSAEDAVDEAHEGEDEDSYDREQEIEDWMDEHEDEWLDMIIGEDIEAAERGEVDLSNYFDYEAFGRDLSFDGYTIVDGGIILVD